MILERAITKSHDDAYASSSIQNVNTFIGVGYASTGIRNAGMIFRSIWIPKGSIINSAHIRFVGSSDRNEPGCVTRFFGETNLNPLGYSTNSDILDKLLTTAYVDWNVPPHTDLEIFNSVDLKDILQELIDRLDWKIGLPVAIQWRDNGSPPNTPRAVKSFDYSPDDAPKLVIDFTPPRSPRIAIARVGKSALSTNPNDFAFHSDYNTFKIIKSLLMSITLVSNTNNQSFSIAHGLEGVGGSPFIPLVRGFAKQDGINTVFFPNSENVSGWNSVSQTAIKTGVKFNYITSDDTNITVNFDNTNFVEMDIDIRLQCLEGISEDPIPANNGSPSGNRVVVAKDGYNALTETDPRNLKYSSEYGTLKYLYKGEQSVYLDPLSATNLQAHASINHDFGYFLYAEAFVRVYIGTPTGDFEPVPFKGAGATTLYDANMIITPNTFELYTQIDGVSFSVWNFDFILFIYHNNLNL